MDLVNATDGGEGGRGTAHSSEAKKKISKAKKGKSFSEEHRKNLSLARRGRVITQETKNKLREAMKNRKRSLVSGRFL
jgi:NUMOD3 motif-containing protein